MKFLLLGLAIAVLPLTASGQAPVFDIHVHIWEGEKSVKDYLAEVKAEGRAVTRFGAIWMARLGKHEETRQKHDELLALAKSYPQLMPVPSVHPYDGQAAQDELKRLAGAGVRLIKIHAHTQKFDVADPRVLTLVKSAGELGIVVLMDNANIIPGD